MVALIVIAVVAVIVLAVLARTVRIVPQARAGVVERLGRYSRTLSPGLALVVPFIDRVRPLLDLREQVVSFPPQPVITEDNLVVNIDSVIYFQVTDAKAATYEIAELHPGDRAADRDDAPQRDRRDGAREDAHLARRDQRPAARRARRGDRQVGDPRQPRRAEGDRPAGLDPGLDGEADARRPREARDDPPGGGAEAVADPDRRGRAGRPRSCAPRASARRRSSPRRGRRRRSRRSSRRSTTGNPDPQLLAYQYLQMLPQIAQGESNKVWIIPSEFQQAVGRIGGAVSDLAAPSAGDASGNGPAPEA